jgi:hypothetical protein
MRTIDRLPPVTSGGSRGRPNNGESSRYGYSGKFIFFKNAL